MVDSLVPLSVAGEQLSLLGARALHWPARDTLMIADLHLGKADIFRRAGVGLPTGGTALDLDRLHILLHAHRIRTLWILGDVLHGPIAPAIWRRQWATWREQHAELAIHAIHGNHDRALRHAGLEFELAGDSVELGPFLLRHEPQPHPDLHVLCGHLHPLARLPGMRRRWPAFWLREHITILPAYSDFTAGVVPRLARGERVVACVEGAAIALPIR